MVSFHNFAAQSLIGAGVKFLKTVRSIPENHLYLSRTGSTNKRTTPKGDLRRQWTVAQHEQSTTSERQHTTDLYEMKEQCACRNQVYFSVAMVQRSSRLRSAQSPR